MFNKKYFKNHTGIKMAPDVINVDDLCLQVCKRICIDCLCYHFYCTFTPVCWGGKEGGALFFGKGGREELWLR